MDKACGLSEPLESSPPAYGRRYMTTHTESPNQVHGPLYFAGVVHNGDAAKCVHRDAM